MEFLVEILEAMFGPSRPASEEMGEAGLKFLAEMLLADKRQEVRIPTFDEWVGVNLLDRDGELKRRKGNSVSKPT